MDEDLKYIKKFANVTIKKACKKANVDSSNLFAGRVAKNKVKKVRKIIESDLAKLYLLEEEDE